MKIGSTDEHKQAGKVVKSESGIDRIYMRLRKMQVHDVLEQDNGDYVQGKKTQNYSGCCRSHQCMLSDLAPCCGGFLCPKSGAKACPRKFLA